MSRANVCRVSVLRKIPRSNDRKKSRFQNPNRDNKYFMDLGLFLAWRSNILAIEGKNITRKKPKKISTAAAHSIAIISALGAQGSLIRCIRKVWYASFTFPAWIIRSLCIDENSLVENEREKKVNVLRTDGGWKYLSTEFKKFLEERGTRHEQTIPWAKRCGRYDESDPGWVREIHAPWCTAS